MILINYSSRLKFRYTLRWLYWKFIYFFVLIILHNLQLSNCCIFLVYPHRISNLSHNLSFDGMHTDTVRETKLLCKLKNISTKLIDINCTAFDACTSIFDSFFFRSSFYIFFFGSRSNNKNKNSQLRWSLNAKSLETKKRVSNRTSRNGRKILI